MNRTTAVCLALALLPGCWSVVPGYDPVGKGITQRHRDRERHATTTFYTWDHVPSTHASGSWSPLVGFTHGVVSLVLAPLSLVLVPVRAITDDAAPDEEEGVLVIQEEEPG